MVVTSGENLAGLYSTAAISPPDITLSIGYRPNQAELESSGGPRKLGAGVSAPYALIYTAEGMPEDVAAELSQVQETLRGTGIAAPSPVETPSGLDVWARLLNGTAPAETTLRAGVAPQQLAGLLHSLQPALSETPLAADLAMGLLSVRNLQSPVVEAVRRAVQKLGGYAVVLSAPQPPSDIWGHTPEARRLMQALKTR